MEGVRGMEADCAAADMMKAESRCRLEPRDVSYSWFRWRSQADPESLSAALLRAAESEQRLWLLGVRRGCFSVMPSIASRQI